MPTAIENYDRFIGELGKQKLPRSVYKYLRFDENTYTNLNEKRLWFSDPYRYNDPFDSRLINPPQLYTGDDILQYDQLRRKRLGLFDHPEDVRENIEYNERDPVGWAKKIHENINLTTVAVCCFSRNRKNILMWSHYADGHKGLCLEFNPHEDTDFFSPTRFRSVKYSNECSSDNYLRDTARTLHNMICTKSTRWKYENEIRIMRLNDTAGLKLYNDKTLKSVIFGCRATDSNIALTKKILGDSVKYKRCELDEKKRLLKIVSLKNHP